MANGNLWGYITKDRERLEVKNAIFENIKRYNEGWIIKENVCVFALYMGKGLWHERLGIEWLGKFFGSNKGYVQIYHTLLVYQPVPIKYDKEGEIIWDYRYQHKFDTFTDEQKTELRQIIMNNQLKQTSQAATTIKQRTIISFATKLFSILIISGIVFLSLIMFRCVKRKRNRKKLQNGVKINEKNTNDKH